MPLFFVTVRNGLAFAVALFISSAVMAAENFDQWPDTLIGFAAASTIPPTNSNTATPRL